MRLQAEDDDGKCDNPVSHPQPTPTPPGAGATEPVSRARSSGAPEVPVSSVSMVPVSTSNCEERNCDTSGDHNTADDDNGDDDSPVPKPAPSPTPSPPAACVANAADGIMCESSSIMSAPVSTSN